MLEFNYDVANGGWQVPEIKGVEPFQLEPSNATLHYSIECFEGCKAFKSKKDEKDVILYRINKNFERMNDSH